MQKLSTLGLLLFLFSSCSSISFLSDEEEDLSIPAELKLFQESYSIERLWKKSFKGPNTLASFKPSFYSGEMFVADASGAISSIDPISGNVNWSIDLDKPLASGIAAGYGKLVVGDTNGFVIALNTKTQEVLWEKNIGGEVLSRAVIDTSLIFIKNSAGELIALDAESGIKEWVFRSQLPALTIRGTGEPIIDSGMIFASFDNGRLGAFQLETGFFLWDAPISYMEGASELENLIDADSAPVIAKQLIFAANYQGNLTAFDKAQKRAVWNAEASSFHSPVIGKGMIMVIGESGSLQSYSLANLSPSWTSDEYSRRDLSNGVIFDGLLLVGDLEGYVHLINPLNGLTVGRSRISNKSIKSLVVFSGLAYAVDAGSNIIAITL